MPLDDGQLRQGVETLSRRWAFARLIALWGPGLYFRNRVVFRPFILAHFPLFTVDANGEPRSPSWGRPPTCSISGWRRSSGAATWSSSADCIRSSSRT